MLPNWQTGYLEANSPFATSPHPPASTYQATMKLAHLLSALNEEGSDTPNKDISPFSASKSMLCTIPTDMSTSNQSPPSGAFRHPFEDPQSDSITYPARSVVKGCKTSGCVVCLRGPPPSFEKGTPIWAQILHLVLYALTESAKLTAISSPKAKIKKYFHLRDDIYEYISQHWDVICRRERIKNWRHTIGMTLSHYQKLFQNGYHIFQNTGYWSLKDNVPSPYLIDPVVGEGSPKNNKRKYREKEGASSNTYDFVIQNSSDNTSTVEQPAIKKIALDHAPQFSNTTGISLAANALPIPSLFSPVSSNSSAPGTINEVEAAHLRPRSQTKQATLRFSAMRTEIERFKTEMIELQQEIDGLQEQVRVKNAEEQFLQEGITAFRDRIKQRIELLRAEMLNNHAEHQQQITNMSTELTQLREMGSDLRNTFQLQFARLVGEEPN